MAQRLANGGMGCTCPESGSAYDRTRLNVQNSSTSIPTRSGKPSAIRAEGDMLNNVVVSQGISHGPSRPQIPNSRGLILTGGGQSGAIRAKSNSQHLGVVAQWVPYGHSCLG